MHRIFEAELNFSALVHSGATEHWYSKPLRAGAKPLIITLAPAGKGS